MSLRSNIILTAISGDAYGFPFEAKKNRNRGMTLGESGFFQWTRLTGGWRYSHLESVPEGWYSDDSELMVCTLKSLCYGDRWLDHLAFNELPIWLSYQTGGGRTSKKSAELLSKHIFPWTSVEKEYYFRAGSNGALMRVLPHALFSNSREEMLLNTMCNTILTHGHPKAIISALFYNYLVQHYYKLALGDYSELSYNDLKFESLYPIISQHPLINDFLEVAVNETYETLSFVNEWNTQLEHILYWVSRIEEWNESNLPNLGEMLRECKAQSEWRGGGVETLLGALISLRLLSVGTVYTELAKYEHIDSDTVMIVVGGLVPFYTQTPSQPVEGLPDYTKLLNYNFICYLIDRLETGNLPFNYFEDSSKHKHLKQNLMNIGRAQEFVAGFGRLRLKQTDQMNMQVSNKQMVRHTILTEIGQEIHIKKLC